jgi:aquaporin Z
MKTKLTNNLVTEFIGTFFLCLVIALNANAGANNLLAIGAILIALIYAGGYISMAHYNPAVTIAFLFVKKISMTDAIKYIVTQIVAATLAALIAKYCFSVIGSGSATPAMMPALMAELLGTFVLVYVILNVATSKELEGNQFYGLAIGLTVVGAGYVLGQYSGGAFNPAVALSQSIVGAFSWSDMWLYLVGAIGGSVVATYVFIFNRDADKTE